MSLGIIVMGLVIILTFVSVVLVIYFGAKENVNPTFGSVDSSEAVRVWQQRAIAMQTLSSKLLGEGGDMQPVAKATASNEADKEAKRQAALARKAARANQSSEA